MQVSEHSAALNKIDDDVKTTESRIRSSAAAITTLASDLHVRFEPLYPAPIKIPGAGGAAGAARAD